jgi:hypothetical protein
MEAVPKNPWQDLYHSIEIDGEPPFEPKPRPASLDDFERETGFTPPESDRPFVRRFGPGEFGCGFAIASPGDPNHPGTSLDLSRLDRGFWANHSEKDWAVGLQDAMDRVRRMVLSCTTGWGDYVGWDRREVTAPEGHEDGIYRLPHSRHEVERLAGSFREFVEGYCLGEGFLRDAPGWDVEAEPLRVFRPARR